MSFVVVTVFKNETTNLKEWVDHYLWQGARHLYMCDNGSTDNPLSILQPYVDKGLVTTWVDSTHTSQFVFQRHIKLEQVRQVVHRLQTEVSQKSEWILIADLDEFWYTDSGIILDYLQTVPSHIKLISKGWRVFGPSEDGEQPKSLRTELVYRQPQETSPKFFFRTMSIPYLNIHDHHVDTPLTPNEISSPSNLHCNHYVLQSYWYFTQIKIPRGCAAGDSSVYTIDYWFRNLEGHTTFDIALAEQVEKSEVK
jgi:hypothetical protein